MDDKFQGMNTRKGMNPIAGLIFFMIALVGLMYVSVGFLDSMGDASHNFQDELDQIQVNASQDYQVVEVEPVEYGVKKDSENLSVNSEPLEKPENYSVVNYATGDFNITDLSGSGEKTLDVEYKNEVQGKNTGFINATFEIFQGYSDLKVLFPFLILGAVILWKL
jgi:hypothetical protein